MPEPTAELEPRVFWSRVRQCSRRALDGGALQPVSTNTAFVEDGGVEFVVRVSDNLIRKQTAPTTYHRDTGRNPFLPPDPELTVGHLPPHHIAILNKFNVLKNHVLVVTRGFVHQESLLTADDFAAVAAGLGNGDSLAFYNAGRIAGASQAHKHFQLVPLPLGRESDIPMAVLFDEAPGGIDTVAGLRFRHSFNRLNVEPADTHAFGQACYEAYIDALHELGLCQRFARSEDLRLPPYNLLLTESWLFMVPRQTEYYAHISVNGLGYAGSLFVSSLEKLEQVRSAGPMTLLSRVSKRLN